jgi:hypothetical protein
MGAVVVFIPPQPAPPGLLLQAENASRSVLHGLDGDPLDRALFSRYFEQFYAACDLDQQGIGKLLKVDSHSLAIPTSAWPPPASGSDCGRRYGPRHRPLLPARRRERRP